MQKVVVLLPEGRLFDAVFEEGVAPAIPSAERVPAEFSRQAALGSVCNLIERADLVIAEVSSRNPNVMYQAGFAHGIGKKVLFLAEHLENLPFDKAKHPVIGYGGNREFLREELARFMRGEKVSVAKEAAVEEAPAKFMAVFGEILAQHGCKHPGEIELENSTTFILRNQELDLALVQDLARKAREVGFRLKLM